MILFELLIALSLTALLLTFLFSFFVESAKLEKKLGVARMAISNRAHLQTRLQSIFSSVDRNSNHPFFYTQEIEKSTSLILLYDNGIDPDPLFGGTLLGRIFLDSDHNLCFATWPHQKEAPSHWRKEILFPRVSSFQFEFLGSSTDVEKQEAIRPITPNLAWRTTWKKGDHQSPSMIRLKIVEEKEKEPLHFAFHLPSPSLFISYSGRRAS